MTMLLSFSTVCELAQALILVQRPTEPRSRRSSPAAERLAHEIEVVVLAVQDDAIAGRARRAIHESRVHAADLVGERALVEAQRVVESDLEVIN